MDEKQKIVAFRKNRAMLAWGLIYVMDLVQKAKILHNDLSPSNVLLHFPPENVDVAYIGVCDWGLASRVVEDKPSLYGDMDEAKFFEKKASRRWIAPELYFVYGPPNDEDRNLERMKREHPFTMKFDAFSVGVLASMIWNREESSELFKDSGDHMIFQVKLDGLIRPDPKERLSLAKVVEDLMGPPYNFKLPESCFRFSI